MIKAIFLATFDINEGPKLHHLLPSPLAAIPPIFDFKALASSLIPPPPICNTSLNILTPRVRPFHGVHRILSYPVCIESEIYPRNAFTFNFGLVLEADIEFSSYLPVVKKLATLFRNLEEQSRFLSQEIAKCSKGEDPEGEVGEGSYGGESKEAVPNRSRSSSSSSSSESIVSDVNEASQCRIYALCEILLEDLNNYGETQIPIDDANTLNIKLFPTYPSPPPLYAWHVPLLTVSSDHIIPSSPSHSPSYGNGDPAHGSVGGGRVGFGGDLTMARILPYINGVNSVKRISLLADADLKLVRKAIRHLLYYGCCLLLDIFAFGAIYAPTEKMAGFVEDEGTQAECARYVTLSRPAHDRTGVGNGGLGGGEGHAGGFGRSPVSTREKGGQKGRERGSRPQESARPTAHSSGDEDFIDSTTLVRMYSSLHQGTTVKAWCAELDPSVLDRLDVRRFITFGVIRGFLYRVHRYAIAPSSLNLKARNKAKVKAKVVNAGRRNKGRSPAQSGKAPRGIRRYADSDDKRITEDEGENDNTDDGTVEEGVDNDSDKPTNLTEDDDGDEEEDKDNDLLAPFLDGTHCFDEICTELAISERELLSRLKAWPGRSSSRFGSGFGGEVSIICR